jgi:hypothetical protein
MAWLVTKAHQLVGDSGRKIPDNRAYLTPNEPLPRHILKKGNY